MTDRDYTICLSTPDGKHTPVIAEVQDGELINIDYITLACSSCGQTTGSAFVMPKPENIDW